MSKKLVSTGYSCSALILLLDGLLKTSITSRAQLVSQLRKLIGELTYALALIQMVQPLMETQNQLLLKGVSGSDLSSLVSYHSNALVVVGLLEEFVTNLSINLGKNCLSSVPSFFILGGLSTSWLTTHTIYLIIFLRHIENYAVALK